MIEGDEGMDRQNIKNCFYFQGEGQIWRDREFMFRGYSCLGAIHVHWLFIFSFYYYCLFTYSSWNVIQRGGIIDS